MALGPGSEQEAEGKSSGLHLVPAAKSENRSPAVTSKNMGGVTGFGG